MNKGGAAERMRGRFADELKELMKRKPLDKISIRELTDGCGVNRQTFYYHFTDIYDLVKWMYSREVVSLVENQKTADTWKESLCIVFRYLDENRSICRCTLDSRGYTHLKRFFYEVLCSVVRKYIYFFSGGRNTDAELLEFTVHFYALSLGAVLENYMGDDCRYTSEQLIKYLERIIEMKRNELGETGYAEWAEIKENNF